MTDTKKKRSLWGVGAFASYGLFVVFVLAMVLFASVQNFELVEKRPYEKGLAYQEQIDRMERTAALDTTVMLEPRPQSQSLAIRIPSALPGGAASGEVRLVRPSNERLDRRWALNLDAAASQEISIAGLARGLWRLEIDWTVDSTTYYFESQLVMP